MNNVSKKILKDFQIRKTKKQKLRFIDYIKSSFPETAVEEGGVIKSRNIVIGNVKDAKVIFTAHYDTCARLPFPNLIMPKNIVLSLLYSVLICVPFFALGFGAYMLFGKFVDDYLIRYDLSFLVGFFVMLFMLFIGVPNKHTANDNTSGVVTLCEIMSKMDEEDRRKCAFVFFDNEEIGLVGSAFFRKKHKRFLSDKLLVNFDCVGDGDNILIVENKSAMSRYDVALRESFLKNMSKKLWFEKASKTFYPSDQMGFPMNIGVVALKGKRPSTFYLNRIHTNRDVVCNDENIDLLADSFVRFINSID